MWTAGTGVDKSMVHEFLSENELLHWCGQSGHIYFHSNTLCAYRTRIAASDFRVIPSEDLLVIDKPVHTVHTPYHVEIIGEFCGHGHGRGGRTCPRSDVCSSRRNTSAFPGPVSQIKPDRSTSGASRSRAGRGSQVCALRPAGRRCSACSSLGSDPAYRGITAFLVDGVHGMPCSSRESIDA